MFKYVFLLTLCSADLWSQNNFVYSNQCIDSLWNHVYRPSRLEVKEKCIEVTGIIKRKHREGDGDRTMLLELDPGQEHLLNEANRKNLKGKLMIEIICYSCRINPKNDANNSCKGYKNTIKLPRCGQRVKVTGTYVLDKGHGWMEIHPISRLEVLHKN